MARLEVRSDQGIKGQEAVSDAISTVHGKLSDCSQQNVMRAAGVLIGYLTTYWPPPPPP